MSEEIKLSGLNIKSVTQKVKLLDIADPRSPTNAFNRTPIQILVEDSDTSVDETSLLNNTETTTMDVSLESFSTPLNVTQVSLDEASFSTTHMSPMNDIEMNDFTRSADEPSMVVSEFSVCDKDVDPSLMEDSMNVYKDVEKETNILSHAKKSIDVDKVLEFEVRELPKKFGKQFYTPDGKQRTPLGAVENTCPSSPSTKHGSSTPLRAVRDRQWKRIQDERQKLGLNGDENIPLPLSDVTASAPSKSMVRRIRRYEAFS